MGIIQSPIYDLVSLFVREGTAKRA